jgi:hypothetical protein
MLRDIPKRRKKPEGVQVTEMCSKIVKPYCCVALSVLLLWSA